MKILVFTDSRNLAKLSLKKGFECLSCDKLRKTIMGLSGPALVYIDESGFCGSWTKTVRFLSKREHVFFGILDPHKKIADIMEFVFAGAVDYLSGNRISRDFDKKHIKRVATYLKNFRKEYAQSALYASKMAEKTIEYIPIPGGWKDIIPGKEYTFSIMFIELDEQEEMATKFGKKNLETALEVFRRFIEKHCTSFGGRLWTWSRFGGIALFPFKATECAAVLCGFRIMLYKLIHDAEESLFPNFISFRIALHLGNLKYQKNNTGEVISDSINSIFHIGKKFAEPGNLYATSEVFNYAPEPIKRFFKNAGTFESRTILKMMRPAIES